MLSDMLKNKRVMTLIGAIIALSVIALLILNSVLKHASEKIKAEREAEATQEIVSSENTPEVIQPSVIETQVDWRTLRVDSCGAPLNEYLDSVQVEFHGGVGVWNSDSPCMDWWNMSTYQDGQLVEGNIVIDAVINDQWVIAHLPFDARLARYDDTVVQMDNYILHEEGKAIWVFYDMRTSEKVTITLNADGSHSEEKVLTDLADIIGSMEPDNQCNWPHSLSFVNQMLESYPSSEIVFASSTWEELDGCSVGFTYVENREAELLVVVQDGQVRTTMLTDLEYPYVLAADPSGNLFYTNAAEFISITTENTVEKQVGNSELLGQIIQITTNYSSFDAYKLYQQSLNSPLITGMQFESRSYQRPLNEAGEETANIYPFTFKSEGKWHTGVIVVDFETGLYSGPYVMDNIREFTHWQSVGQTITGYYNDGSFITLNSTGSPAPTTEN